jgi:hypothetical protein
MLKNFDSFCESFLVEGRKSDNNKKFKINIEKVKSHINDIGNKHHHYVHDKGHFETIADELDPNEVYTPRSFVEHVKSLMKGKGKSQIADGYAKLMYTFLNDRVNSPFEEHKKEEVSEQPESNVSDEESEDFTKGSDDFDEFA